MGKVQSFIAVAKELAVKHAPTILTGLGIIGMGVTVVVACESTPKAVELLEAKREEKALIAKAKEDTDEGTKVAETGDLRPSEVFFECSKVYWPVALMFATSAVCLIFANKVNLKRQAALLAAYQLSESKFKDYQEEVLKTIGKNKEEKVRDNVAKETLEKNPPDLNKIIIANESDVLCYDSISGRYFVSNTAKIRNVEALMNRRLLNESCITLNDLYEELGLEPISIGDNIGWRMDTMHDIVEFDLTQAKVTDEGKPCIYIDYKAGPLWIGWGD